MCRCSCYFKYPSILNPTHLHTCKNREDSHAPRKLASSLVDLCRRLEGHCMPLLWGWGLGLGLEFNVEGLPVDSPQ